MAIRAPDGANKKKGGLCVSRGKYSEEKLDILTAGQNSAQGKTIS